MKWRNARQSDNIEDRRGQPGRRMAGLPLGGKGGLLGLVVIIGISMLLGVNPLQVLSGLEGAASQDVAAPPVDAQAEQPQVEFASRVLGDTEDVWGQILPSYQPATLVLYRAQTPTACGPGAASAGPFYCPGDRKVYLDLSFLEELQSRFGAPGDFAAAYVIAHEVGHHVQTLTGISGKVRQAQQGADERTANVLQVRMELQADCYAGVWAHHAEGRNLLEAGDVQEAMGAAAAVGDDTLQKQATGRVVPDAFTHGSAAQRQRWFMAGYQNGNPNACDTFAARAL